MATGFSLGLAAGTDIPVEHLDFGYVRECKNAKEVEKILQILRYGRMAPFTISSGALHALTSPQAYFSLDKQVLPGSSLPLNYSGTPSISPPRGRGWLQELFLGEEKVSLERGSTVRTLPISV